MSANNFANYQYLATAPGRVNLLGEHVDYNDGIVLPVAIDRRVTLAADPRRDRLVKLVAKDLNKMVTFDLDQLDAKVDIYGESLPTWARYPAGVAWSLQRNGFKLGGLDGVITSTIPIGSGLSSSAAIELAFAVLWQAMEGWVATPMTLARLGQMAENLYVGVSTGLMDQFASAHGKEGHALYFDTRSLEWHLVPLPAGVVIVIADSRVSHSLHTSAYNERRASCEEAVRLLQPHLPDMRALRDVSLEDFNRLQHLLPEETRKRARHVVTECRRVEEASRLLEAGNAAGFGRLMYEGHASLKEDYEVSIPELDALVEIARQLPGCWGARLTGAGFGGCTVNLVQADQAEMFIAGLKEGYRQATGKEAEVALCHASDGASVRAPRSPRVYV